MNDTPQPDVKIQAVPDDQKLPNDDFKAQILKLTSDVAALTKIVYQLKSQWENREK
jgi:hypothetical protein